MIQNKDDERVYTSITLAFFAGIIFASVFWIAIWCVVTHIK